MELHIGKYLGKDQNVETNYWPVMNFKVLAQSSSALLVSESDMDIDGIKMVHHEIFKVQFIASCQVEKLENPLTVAFYIGELGELYSHVIGGLSGNYYNADTQFFMVDYSSYSDICRLTNETLLPFSEYIQFIKGDKVGINSYIEKEGQMLNYDKQLKLYSDNIATEA